MALDPHAKRFLDRLAATNPPSALTLSVQARRAALGDFMGFAGRSEPVEHCAERTIPGPAGELRVRIYTPAGTVQAKWPALIYFHGGGLVAGSLDSHDAICRSLANASGCRVLSVDYRLAPESPFPAALEDACGATRWIAAHCAELGIDPSRLAVCGDSAGATLAALVCQRAIEDPQVSLALQVLLCPIMDFGAATASRREFASGYFVDEATLEHDLKYYLGGAADRADPRVSPLRAPDLSALPAACIHTAEFDPLRDEGAAYAERLRLAGVQTTYRCHSGMIHLFYGMSALIPNALSAWRQIGGDIRAMLA